MDDEKQKELDDIIKKLQNVHYPSGPIYTKGHKAAALLCSEENELEAIYNLVESHSPALRVNAVHRYEKAMHSEDNVIPLNKNNVNFKCSTASIKVKIETMLEQLNEMPKEWTLIQLTSQFNAEENLAVDSEKLYTNPLHITVLNCGKDRVTPFTVTLNPPEDTINGSVIEIRQEMCSIITDNVKTLENFQAHRGKLFITAVEKQVYNDKRYLLNSRLENLVKVIQDRWLGEWRCLLIGKFVDNAIENMIMSKIEEILKREECQLITEKNRSLLRHIIKGSGQINLLELKKALHLVFPEEQDKSVRLSFIKAIQDISAKHHIAQQIRHPVILIVDEKLDFLPWEMIDVLQDHPVSRMPSLHFTYALFKEHESSIVNGIKVNINSNNGTYLINPGLDLKNMETRLRTFFNYWLPDWSGLVGVAPSEDDFKNMLTNNDIFIYSGHGNGTQFLSGEKIQKMRVNTVVLLFGCNSVRLLSIGPQVEMYGSYHMYLIACSPCIVGTLWPVTDVETDLVTTEFLSQWIPSAAPTHWQLMDKKDWQTGGTLKPGNQKVLKESDKHEPELLRALCKARKAARQYIMKAASVARGLPVKIQ